jgi:hypothetical protein
VFTARYELNLLNIILVKFRVQRPCQGCGVTAPSSYRGGTDSIPGLSM